MRATAVPPAPAAALACRAVTVRYGDVVALHEVSVEFGAGRIHAIVGQNGAGKTTFARVCAGLVQPSSGSLAIGGKTVGGGSVEAARRNGVELVHQSFALPPSFTVAEALEFGSARRAPLVYSRRMLVARWRAHLASLDVRARLTDRIRDLPVETQQGVEIARALVGDARVLILDEPTAVLGPPGIELLFSRIRRLQQDGVTIVLILHKIREVLALAESIAVLRAGRLVAAGLDAGAMTSAELAEAIVGSAALEHDGRKAAVYGAAGAIDGNGAAAAGPVPESARTPLSKPAPVREQLLSLTAASTSAGGGKPALDGITLTVGRAEIVGIAGVEGNGQQTLVNALAAFEPLSAGTIVLAGVDVSRASLLDRRRRGLRIIPFERNTQGLSLASPLWQNWSAPGLVDGGLFQPIDPQRLRRAARAAFDRWSVRYASVDQSAGELSGGNAQKVILAREVDVAATLIVAAQPTRGLDIAATAFVWRALRDARARGCAVLVVSSDLDELCEISDRIVVMLSGAIVAQFEPPYDLATIGGAMAGVNA